MSSSYCDLARPSAVRGWKMSNQPGQRWLSRGNMIRGRGPCMHPASVSATATACRLRLPSHQSPSFLITKHPEKYPSAKMSNLPSTATNARRNIKSPSRRMIFSSLGQRKSTSASVVLKDPKGVCMPVRSKGGTAGLVVLALSAHDHPREIRHGAWRLLLRQSLILGCRRVLQGA
jgi:hypothetical protein